MRTAHVIAKVANLVKSARVHASLCEYLNVHDKVLKFFPITQYSQCSGLNWKSLSENLNLNEKIQSTNTDFEKMQKLELCDKEI